MKRLVVAAGVAAVLMGIAACTGQTPGSPTTGTDPTGGQSGSAPTSASEPRALPYNHPCSLVTSSDLHQLGATTAASRDDAGTSHGCSFNTSAASMNVGIRVNVGLSGFQLADGGTVTSMTIGRHQAEMQQDTATGGCTVGIGVTQKSRVDIVAQMLNPYQNSQACPAAKNVAQVVEPNLPPAG